MKRLRRSLLVVASIGALLITTVAGAGAATAAASSPPTTTVVELECATGWGSGTHKVSTDRINDGYCDCPLDGSDEPNTNACSGSMVGSFTGIPAVSFEG